MAKVCIICYQEKSGTPVLDDAVIRAIRGMKQRLNTAKNNTRVVCPGCMENYKKKRQKYERDLVMHVVLAGVVLVVFVLAPVFTSGFSLAAVVLGLLLAALIIALSVFSHCPKIAAGPQEREETKRKARKK
jgi:hypothetical protein